MNPINDWIDPEETHRLASALMGGIGARTGPPVPKPAIQPAKPAAPARGAGGEHPQTAAAPQTAKPFSGSSFVATHASTPKESGSPPAASSPAADSLARRLKEHYRATGVLILGPDGTIRGGDPEMKGLAFAARGTLSPIRLHIAPNTILYGIPALGSGNKAAVALLAPQSLDSGALEAIQREVTSLSLP
jgi:hypothetical protein